MNLVVDCGNSLVKLAVFDNNQEIIVDRLSYDDTQQSVLRLCATYSIKSAIVSSVTGYEHSFIAQLKKCVGRLIELTHETRLPIINLYKTPETLGKDRIAAAVGANSLYPNCTTLVVDAGTTITYELVTSKNEYAGGCISPGLEMRFKALHTFTKKLPLVASEFSSELIGLTTTEAIQFGVQNGLIFEIDGYINSFREKHADLKVIFTGGNADFLAKQTKNSIFVVQNLVLLGLNRILEYNA